MKRFLVMAGFAAVLFSGLTAAHAGDAVDVDAAGLSKKSAENPVPLRILGNPNAPIKVDEYISLTCSHCAEFYNKVLPELEKKYIDTGKVKFIVHDFVMDPLGFKAALLARCMPPDEFFPFIRVLYRNQTSWVISPNAQNVLMSYAKLGGLPDDKATACLADTKLQDAIVAERTAVESKIDATPTFIVDDGVQTLKGAMPAEDFSRLFDEILATENATKH